MNGLWGTSPQPLAYYGLLFRCEASLGPSPGRRLVGPCNLKIFTLSASLDVLNTSWVGLCRGSNINQIFQIFRGVSRPSRSIRGPNHGTSYIFWKLWPTAFRFRFPKCIFCQYIFANCTMLMLLLKLCEFILGKSSCAKRELIVLACMCRRYDIRFGIRDLPRKVTTKAKFGPLGQNLDFFGTIFGPFRDF